MIATLRAWVSAPVSGVLLAGVCVVLCLGLLAMLVAAMGGWLAAPALGVVWLAVQHALPVGRGEVAR